jgi:uncharacterized membrane protein
MDFVIDDRTSLGVVDWVDTLIISVIFIAVQVLDSATVTGVMKEESIIGLGVLDKPAESANNVFAGRNHDRILLVIGQDDHVLPLVVIALHQEGRDVVYVVDTSTQLALLAKIVDADEKRLATTGTFGVLESIAFRGTVAELLGNIGGRWSGSSVLGVVVSTLWKRIAVRI